MAPLPGPGEAPLRAEQYLAPETLAQLAPFELRAKTVAEGAMHGLHRSPRQGSAVEFASHRQYAFGDSVRHLDWKAWGRLDKLYIRQYRQETNLDVLLLADCSASMRFGTLSVKMGWGGTEGTRRTARWTKFDHAAATAAAIAYLCLSQGDRVGMALCADGVQASVRTAGSGGQWKGIVRRLAAAPLEGRLSLAKSVEQLLARSRKRMLVAILSDFLIPLDDVRTALARLRHAGHDCLLLALHDRQEIRFTLDETAPFRGLEGEGEVEVDACAVREAYLAGMRAHMEELERLARGVGFDLTRLDTHESVGPAIAGLLARRETFARKRSAS